MQYAHAMRQYDARIFIDSWLLQQAIPFRTSPHSDERQCPQVSPLVASHRLASCARLVPSRTSQADPLFKASILYINHCDHFSPTNSTTDGSKDHTYRLDTTQPDPRVHQVWTDRCRAQLQQLLLRRRKNLPVYPLLSSTTKFGGYVTSSA